MGRTICHTHDSVDLCNHAHCEDIGIFAKAILLWFVRFSLRALEYGFGMYVGAIVGWVVGHFGGGVYAELFEPVHFADFPNMEEIMRWDRMPYTFATAGIFVGAVVGALTVFLVPSEPLEPTDKT